MVSARSFLLLPLVLGLNACSAKSLTQVRGEVRGWTYGAGSVEFLSDDLKTLATADLDSVGRFNLDLPDAQTVTPLLEASLIPELPAGCTSTVKASSGAKYYTLGDVTAYPSKGQKSAYTLVSEDRAGTEPLRVTKRLYIYATQAVNVSGTLSCPVRGQQATASYGLDLKPGWNRVSSNQTLYQNGASQTVLSGTGEDGFDRWSVAP